jgi:large subunit ribosomal protein L9|tara:strand:- start:16300 stop:17025 length:726 start_codon:yes stop_codon:yes gene_type:complete
MEIILLESLNKLGGIGDIVKVKDGYARNFLIPQKKALRASNENKEYFAKIKKDLVEKNNKVIEKAQLAVKEILSIEVIFIRNASDNGQLYGSVSPKDISNYFHEKKIDVKPSNVNFHNAIKKVGIYDINIKLHPEVGCNIKINVSTSLENAEIQKLEAEKPKAKETQKKANTDENLASDKEEDKKGIEKPKTKKEIKNLEKKAVTDDEKDIKEKKKLEDKQENKTELVDNKKKEAKKSNKD